MGVVKKGLGFTLKQLQKLKKQAEKEVAKEEEIAYKKFHPNESAEMHDLAESKMRLQGILDEIDKIEKLDKPFKSGGKLRGMGKALRGGGKVMRG